MKVKEVMTTDPATCSSRDNLASAALTMWNRDCGALPVVDDGRIVGVITDRDICMSLAFKGSQPSSIRVAEVIDGHPLYSCSPNEDLTDALKIMRDRQIRRLPVLEDGKLHGVLSMNDIALVARDKGGLKGSPTFGDVVDAMQGICSHRPHAVAA